MKPINLPLKIGALYKCRTTRRIAKVLGVFGRSTLVYRWISAPNDDYYNAMCHVRTFQVTMEKCDETD